MRKSSFHFPTFCQFHVRVNARPFMGYDVMRTADSWLAANLTDTMIHLEVKYSADEPDWKSVPARWQRLFRENWRHINSWGWRACIQQYVKDSQPS